MPVLFPLSIPGKIVLILIAIALGIIWSMLMWPDSWKKWLRRGDHSQYIKNVEEKRIEKKTKKPNSKNKTKSKKK